ncbi:phage tail protein [Mesorhizobium sp. B2-5-9]|uniref:phage tail protein n=1 Tax=Mesorhizobium sp. B2-5-9 TaxID=2589921 RepID=UPI001126329B|nr:phage tail protein [Mesorhizobium sp. B2-5-9]TPK15160.1 phage tail protein [Mesorhizobium sp. B2-5-9]
MADLSYFHGVKLEESTETPSLLRISRFGTTFLNGTAPDADDAAFPLNTPTLVTSQAGGALLGAAGTLLADLTSIFGEGGSYVIVNRVEHDDDAAELEANLLGDATARTGLYAALRAKSLLGIQPRVLVTAGATGAFIDDGVVSLSLSSGGADYTSAPTVALTGGAGSGAAAVATINKNKVGSITLGSGGTGYTSAPTVALSAPPAGGVQATATAAVASGAITGFTVTNAGSGYVTPPTVTITGAGTGGTGTAVLAGPVIALTVTAPGEGYTSAPSVGFSGGAGSGAAATANVGDVANAYISALNTICPQIRARAYISGPNTTNAEAVRFRGAVNGGRILIIDPLAIKNVAGVPVVSPMAAAWAGVRSRVVASDDGVSGSVSNKIMRTIDGVARTIQYPADSNYLNEQHVNTVINERGGFRTWGSRLATDDLIWAFDSVRATADMINESLEDLYFVYVDRKFTKANLKMMVEDGNAALRVFKLNNDVLGGRVWLSDLNTPTLNAGGKVFLNVEFEPVGIMEQIHITTYRNILYYQLLLDDVRGAIENGPLTLAA